jgi:hypothetical protein
MMRRLILIILVAWAPLSAGAAKRLTVAQFEQQLTAAVGAHKPDAEIAREIGAAELSERITEIAFVRLNSQVQPGSRAALALGLLVDRSSFLDPPASDIPAAAAPAEADQQRMLAAARNYVAQTLPRLPNFLATRTINRFDDSPQEPKKGAWPVRAGLHQVDTSSREISVRDERENQPPAQGSAVWKQQIGLVSGGEFGTTLGMILTDTLEGKVAWSRWEQSPNGMVAVFQYSAPSSASHFEVIGAIQRQAAVQGSATSTGGPRGILGIGAQPNDNPARISTVRIRPGYHGSIWLDPATGTVLRITMEAEMKDSVPFQRAAILVQYGPVTIGDRSFICPVRSLAFSVAPNDATTLEGNTPTEWLNETLFTGYHRFAATTRLIPGDASPPHDPPN